MTREPQSKNIRSTNVRPTSLPFPFIPNPPPGQDTYEQIICERAADGTDTVGGYRDDGYGIATWLEGLGGGNQDCTLERRAGTTDFVVAMIGGNERTEVNIYFTERDPQAYRVTFKW